MKYTKIGTVKTEPPPPIKPKEIPTSTINKKTSTIIKFIFYENIN